MTKRTLRILRDWLAFPTILILSYFFIVEPYFDKKDREIIANREYSIAHIIKRYGYNKWRVWCRFLGIVTRSIYVAVRRQYHKAYERRWLKLVFNL